MRTAVRYCLLALLLCAISIPAFAEVVINQVDYDQPGNDMTEYIELRNNGPGMVQLEEYTIELVNGTGGTAAVYQTITLPVRSLLPGRYFVICGGAVPTCDFAVTPAVNLIQNGSPDAIGLRHKGVLVDAVSYEGDTGSPYTEGTGFTGADDNVTTDLCIARFPDGQDTNNNNADWRLQPSNPRGSNGVHVPGASPLAVGGGALALAGLAAWVLIARRRATA